jgi:hypothetical protein
MRRAHLNAATPPTISPCMGDEPEMSGHAMIAAGSGCGDKDNGAEK